MVTPVDVAIWFGAVTALAQMVKAYHEARVAGLKREEAVQQSQEARRLDKLTATQSLNSMQLVISPSLLDVFIQDIKAAEDRFTNVINDPQYTPAQVDQEEARARLTICTHLERITQFNGGQLPLSQLETVSKSFGCNKGA
jgi:hypothetical protein